MKKQNPEFLEAKSSSVYERSDFKVEDVTLNLRVATERLYEGNRRLNTRMEMKGCKIKIRDFSDFAEPWVEASPENFSAGGIRFSSKMKLRKDQKILIFIKPDWGMTGIPEFCVGAYVRYSTFDGDRSISGAQFHFDLVKDIRSKDAEASIQQLSAFLETINKANDIADF